MFFKGIVEDNNDELQLGRVKVRIVGKHSPQVKKADNYEFLPTSDLPYAVPLYPAGASSISGVSNFSVPSINSIVVCGYFDDDEQELFYIGTLGLLGSNKIEGFGISSNPNPTKNYPLSDLVKGTNTITSSTKYNSLFSVPPSDYAAVYPKNNVIETKSGHVIELDDTDGVERIRIYHTSGTYNETNADGTNVESVVGDKYIESKNINLHCDTNCNLYAGADVNVTTGANVNVICGGDATMNVTGSTTITSGVAASVTAPSVMVKGTSYSKIESSGTMEIISSGNTTVTSSSGEITVTASKINLDA